MAGDQARHHTTAGVAHPGSGSCCSFGYGGCRARRSGGLGLRHSGSRYFHFVFLTYQKFLP